MRWCVDHKHEALLQAETVSSVFGQRWPWTSLPQSPATWRCNAQDGRGGCAPAWTGNASPTHVLVCTPELWSFGACCNVKQQRERLTPVQRLRQAELSWFRSGHTTTLFSSLTEKELVSGAARDGGMAASINGRSFATKQWHVESEALGRGSSVRACAAEGGEATVTAGAGV